MLADLNEIKQNLAVLPTDLISRSLQKEGWARARFIGSSMYPTLKEGMEVLVKSVPAEEIRPCDIILYKRNGVLIGHRVVRIFKRDNRRVFLVKGDNQIFYRDRTFISGDDLLGVIKAVFYLNSLQKNILLKNKLILWLYVVMGNCIFFMDRKKILIPKMIRKISAPSLVRCAHYFKNLVHFLQLSI